MSARKVPGVRKASRALSRLKWRVRLAGLRAKGRHRIALASFPRSGNTWFRFLLENATGEQTGTLGSRAARVLPRGGDGLVIKTHQRDSYRYTDAIHLVRNPFDVIDSYYDWKASCGWRWKHGETDWDAFVKLVVPLWSKHTRHWLDASPRVFRVRYEDCLSDPTREFRTLLEWLERPTSDEALAQAIRASSFEELKRKQSADSDMGAKFFRRGKAAKGIDRFTTEQRRWVLTRARREIAACGYERLLDGEAG
jgi:hypothetical protein